MATTGSWDFEWESGWWSSTSNKKWYEWKGNFSRSGNTITLSGMQLRVRFQYPSGASGTGMQDDVTVTGGSQQHVSFGTFSNVYYTPWVNINNTSFSVTTGSTSAWIQMAIAGEQTGGTTIYFDPNYQTPATPTLSGTATGPHSASITYSLTSFGYPASGTLTLYRAKVPWTATDWTPVATQTSTGTFTFSDTNLDSSSTYAYYANADNTARSAASTTINVSLPTGAVTYCSVSGTRKKQLKEYCSVSGTRKKVKKIYASVNGARALMFEDAS